jgi:putative flippase GtrA
MKLFDRIKKTIYFVWSKYKSFILYSLIGSTGASLDFLLFLLFTNVFDWNIFVANIISVSLGVIDSFVLNVLFNFKVRDKLFLRFISFYSVGMVGLGLSSLILKIFVSDLGFERTIVKFLSIIVVVIVQYSLNKLISFRESKTN